MKKNQNVIQSISIKNDKDKSFSVHVDETLLQKFSEGQQSEYKSFLEKYYERQGFWLNFWLTILALLMGLMAIIIPICFMKFQEKKEEQLKELLQKTKAQQRLTRALASKITRENNEQVQSVENTKIEMRKALEETQKQMTSDLVEVKQFVDQMKRTSRLNEANRFFMLGLKEKSVENALSYFSKAIQVLPQFKDAYRQRAICYEKLGDLDAALRDIDKCLEIDSYYMPALVTKFIIFSKKKDYTKGLDVLELIKEGQRGFEYYYNKVEACIFTEKYKEALESLSALLKLQNTFIFKDDYNSWTTELQSKEQNKEIKQLLENIEKLPKREREDGE